MFMASEKSLFVAFRDIEPTHKLKLIFDTVFLNLL